MRMNENRERATKQTFKKKETATEEEVERKQRTEKEILTTKIVEITISSVRSEGM